MQSLCHHSGPSLTCGGGDTKYQRFLMWHTFLHVLFNGPSTCRENKHVPPQSTHPSPVIWNRKLISFSMGNVTFTQNPTHKPIPLSSCDFYSANVTYFNKITISFLLKCLTRLEQTEGSGMRSSPLVAGLVILTDQG